MRILVLSVNYWPEATGIGALCTRRCEYLASRGHDVTVCTTFPYYPQWRVAEEYRNQLWSREIQNNVMVLRSWAWIPKRPNSIKRVLFEASFLACNLLRAAYAEAPDLLIAVSPPLGLAVTAGLLSRRWNTPYVYDVMDLQPDAAIDLGMLKPGVATQALYSLERIAYRKAALISTLTEGMRNRIVSKPVPADKVTLFPAPADRDLFLVQRNTEGESFRSIHGLTGSFLIVHSGNMGVKQGLDVVLRTAELSRDYPDIVYLLVGDGAMRSQLEDGAKARKLSNVRFLPVQSQQQFPQLLAAADIALITQQRSVANILFPSKTVSLMAAGCPIVASVNKQSEVARVLEKSGAGIVIEPEDPISLFQTVVSLKECGELTTMSEAGRRYARAYWDEDVAFARMEAELMKVAEKVEPSSSDVSINVRVPSQVVAPE
jgi:colanic acid biosynthesis glycosyl transferase WcaI